MVSVSENISRLITSLTSTKKEEYIITSLTPFFFCMVSLEVMAPQNKRAIQNLGANNNNNSLYFQRVTHLANKKANLP